MRLIDYLFAFPSPFFWEFHCFFFFLEIKNCSCFAFFLALRGQTMFVACWWWYQQQQFECVIWALEFCWGQGVWWQPPDPRQAVAPSWKPRFGVGNPQVHMGTADLPFLLLLIQGVVKPVVDHSLSLKSPTSTHWMGPDLTSPVRNLARRRHMHNKAVFSLCANCRCKRWLSHVEASILATEITTSIISNFDFGICSCP